MKYLVRKSIVQMVGQIWQPGIICGQEKTLSDSDVDNCRDDDGKITRESVEQWLMTHSGDFQSVMDFHASIEGGPNTIDIPWATEEGEMQYYDCVSEPA
jgi:hypothetical protein